jgi:tRNA modification GTPase
MPVQHLSAKTGAGLIDLKRLIVEKTAQQQPKFSDEVVITTARHHDILGRVIAYMNAAEKTIESGRGFEFAAVDLREALNTLGEITGESVADDILNRIFENFCVGK